jgi:hypothetical protein
MGKMITVKGIDGVLKDIEKKSKAIIAEKKIEIIDQLVKDLKNETPVDTGKARDGWQRDDDSIVNDVEYIDHLNAGSSEQAPAYFVEKTLLSRPGIKPSGIIVKSK